MARLATESRIGQAGEDYLRAVFKLTEAGAPATTSAIASATSMVKKLRELKLLTHSPYRASGYLHGLRLPSGLAVAPVRERGSLA